MKYKLKLYWYHLSPVRLTEVPKSDSAHLGKKWAGEETGTHGGSVKSTHREGNLIISNKVGIYLLTQQPHFWDLTLKTHRHKYKAAHTQGCSLLVTAKHQKDLDALTQETGWRNCQLTTQWRTMQPSFKDEDDLYETISLANENKKARYIASIGYAIFYVRKKGK